MKTARDFVHDDLGEGFEEDVTSLAARDAEWCEFIEKARREEREEALGLASYTARCYADGIASKTAVSVAHGIADSIEALIYKAERAERGK